MAYSTKLQLLGIGRHRKCKLTVDVGWRTNIGLTDNNYVHTNHRLVILTGDNGTGHCPCLGRCPT